MSVVEETPHQFKICDAQAELIFSVTQGEIIYCLGLHEDSLKGSPALKPLERGRLL